MSSELKKIEIVRSDDPKNATLIIVGYDLVGTSWGAHLEVTHSFDFKNLESRIKKAKSNSYKIKMLSSDWAQEMFDLEILNNPHYPFTPATAHVIPTLESTKALWRPNSWVFGATLNNKLVGCCATSKRLDRVEIDFGSVHPEHRGKGVGIATVSYALLTLHKLGLTKFATGGAEVNSASRATVEALGFTIDEVWNSYQKSCE